MLFRFFLRRPLIPGGDLISLRHAIIRAPQETDAVHNFSLSRDAVTWENADSAKLLLFTLGEERKRRKKDYAYTSCAVTVQFFYLSRVWAGCTLPVCQAVLQKPSDPLLVSAFHATLPSAAQALPPSCLQWTVKIQTDSKCCSLSLRSSSWSSQPSWWRALWPPRPFSTITENARLECARSSLGPAQSAWPPSWWPPRVVECPK